MPIPEHPPKSRWRWKLPVASLALLIVAVTVFQIYRATRRTPRVDWVAADLHLRADILPTLKTYCWDCHGDGVRKGDVNFDGCTNIQVLLADRRLWERVLNNVQSGEMPPKKRKTQPSLVERTNLVAWLDHTLFPIDPANPDPGRVTIRRLNRTEYNNTIRDLVGVDFEPASDFPQDDVGYGFDTIGDVLSVPPILVERYLSAAEAIFDEAIISGPLVPRPRRINPDKIVGHAGTAGLATLVSNSQMTTVYEARLDAEYLVRIQAYGDQAGDEKVKMQLRMDGKDVELFEVRRTRGASKAYENRMRLSPGRHTIGVAFLNDYYKETMVDEENGKGRPIKRKRIEDRNLQVEFIEVTGPFSDQPPPLTAAHRRIFSQSPTPSTTNVVARSLIEKFTRRAYRRTVTVDELNRLEGLFIKAQAAGENFEISVKQALTAVLVSPHFLFRGELQPQPDNPGSIHRISEDALASRLSYFLWSSMPDDELFGLAAKGTLRKNLSAQLRRMLKDPKARALVDNFAGQWLQLRTLEIIAPDARLFPEFDEALRRAARRETELLFEFILKEDRPVTDLLEADYTFINERLSRHYGLPGVSGDDFVKVSLKGTARVGLLTQASFLALTSNPTRTSPVKRGKWVLDNILALPPPPPPPDVPALESKETHGTLRQRMDAHRNNAVCASCHAKMDPIGFAFEHFDAVGRFRETDGTESIDAAGVLDSGESFNGHLELNQILTTQRRRDFLRCVVEKLFTYALGRGLDYYDRPAVAAACAKMENDGFRFSSLIQSITDSVPFQFRRGDGDPLNFQDRR